MHETSTQVPPQALTFNVTLAIGAGTPVATTSDLRNIFLALADKFTIPGDEMLDRTVRNGAGEPVGTYTISPTKGTP
jgi:hypothetical protein